MKKKKSPSVDPYPQIKKLGLNITVKSGIDCISSKEIDRVFNEADRKKFSEYFGVQTCILLDDGAVGLYCWDVEAVLERMNSGKLIGTQKYWD